MRTVLLTIVALMALAVLSGAAVVFGGLYNVSARAGHWPITEWVLHTAYRQSVKLRAPPEHEVPELTDALAALGARHFDRACRQCHAAPGEERTATIERMMPRPPPIEVAVRDWDPRHLGWILREGVKMSGMPGWPSSRQDEMWSVVAFLVRVQGGMDAQTYAALTETPEARGPEGLGYCAGCHGLDGRSGNPHIPRLDLLDAAYLTESITAYDRGLRESGIMSHAASEFMPEQLDRLVAYFGSLPAAAEPQPADPTLAARGRDLAHAATADPEVPACAACHGPEANPASPMGPGPAIAGQYETYLGTQLRLWREGARGGGPQAQLMRAAARDLSDEDIAALAAYYASLLPSADRDG
ncbi:c-type cytochrome [Rubellimicrobium arenae]|uniref:c-type cytochrome n=1 Tax=Rubellimicrobium arenae TaxID=2817372 RepID=UPI001B3112F7|nr:c-type cytochrome [Rubellimicrobium arenae]